MRALILDDHPLIRKAIHQVIHNSFPSWTILEASAGEEAMRLMQSAPVDLLVLDIGLPGESGLTVLKQVRRRSPQTRCLVLSIHSDPQYVRLAINSGAVGYLSKETAPEELDEAIRSVMRDGRYLSALVQDSVEGDFQRAGTHARGGGQLSARELEVLNLLAKGKTVSRAAKQLKLSVKTVSTYRLRLLEKLGLETTAELIRYAVERGLAR